MEKNDNQSGAGEYDAPWEKAFDSVLTPFEEFIHRQSSSSLLLAGATLIALFFANSAFADLYHHIIHLPVRAGFGAIGVEKSLHHWVNDGLMAIFFFVVGLELKRSFLVGELAKPKNAALPIFAAIGGMLFPALVYFAINPDGAPARGWGVPMATDIAFAVGVLYLLGSRIPSSLLTFLIALAIVDDLGAVLVIALFYTETINPVALMLAGVFLGVMVAMKYGGIRVPLPYFIMAILLWFALAGSGVHATIAGILGALTVPVRPKYDTDRFRQYIDDLMAQFDASTLKNPNVLTNTELQAIIQTLENGLQRVQAPLQRLERLWHIPVAYLILPVFAFMNAGISIQQEDLTSALNSDVTIGVVMGLVLGKVVGIAGASYLAVLAGLAHWPKDTGFLHVLGVAFLGGIGFTMSIFVADLAFPNNPVLLQNAKTGILIASLFSGIVGAVVLRIAGNKAIHRKM